MFWKNCWWIILSETFHSRFHRLNATSSLFITRNSICWRLTLILYRQCSMHCRRLKLLQFQSVDWRNNHQGIALNVRLSETQDTGKWIICGPTYFCFIELKGVLSNQKLMLRFVIKPRTDEILIVRPTDCWLIHMNKCCLSIKRKRYLFHLLWLFKSFHCYCL